VAEIEGRVFFLCGPPPFMDRTRGILAELGVGPERIRQENFGGAGAVKGRVAGQQEVMVEFARSGKRAMAAEGETVLAMAAAAGVDIPSACRQGQCGTCRTRLLEGQVEMSCENGLDPESKARGFVLTCVGRPAGNVKLDA
jgi:ferredoxin